MGREEEELFLVTFEHINTSLASIPWITLEEVAYNKLVKHRNVCVSNSLSGTAFLQSSKQAQAHQIPEEAVKF